MINPDLTLDDLPDEARQRMHSAEVITLTPGEILYRAANSETDKSFRFSSPWWLTAWDFTIVEAEHNASVSRHHEQAMTLGFLMRSAAAIPQDVSRTDRLIRAMVQESIKVFKGIGIPQNEIGPPDRMFKLTWTGWKKIRQLYIPGIKDKHGLTLNGLRAIRVLEDKPIASQQLWESAPKHK